MPQLLRLFGSPHVSSPGRVSAVRGKQLALLAVLAYRAPNRVTRDYLSRLLWPHSSLRSSRHSLSQALYSIRREFGDGVVRTDDEALLWGKLECDVVQLHTCLDAGAYDEAAQLFEGEFCENLVVPGCVEFEQWLDGARAEIHRVAAELLNEPLEVQVRQKIEQVLRVRYDSHPATPAHHDGTPPAEERPAPRFVGRVAQRRILEDAGQKSTKGEVRTALVSGEPGIGKTALCTRVVKKTVLRGSCALTAAGYEIQSRIPYGVIRQLLADAHRSHLLDSAGAHWLGVLHELIPAIPAAQYGPDPASAEDVSHQIAGAVHHVLSQAARSRALTIFIDDVQWADSVSMSIIHYLVHCDTKLPIFVLLASRNNQLEFARDGHWDLSVALSLEGLSLSESRLLVEARSSRTQGLDPESIQRVTGGNPLLIHAFLDGGSSDLARLPPSAKQYFQRELSTLSPDAQIIGAALSALSEALSAPQLAWITEVDEEAMNAALTDLVAKGLAELRRSDGLFYLRHDVVREAFSNILPPVSSARLHGRIAKLLRDEGWPATVIAAQLTIAGTDSQTCQFALEAARASQRLYAYREAEHFYQIAIAHSADPDVELESRIALSTVFLRQGRFKEGEAVLAESVRHRNLDPHQSALLEAHLLIARLSEVGPPTIPADAFRRALVLEPLLPPGTAAKLYADIATNAQQGLHELVQSATDAMHRPLSQMEQGPERLEFQLLMSAFKATVKSNEPHGELDRLTEESSKWPAAHVAGLSAGGLVRISRGNAVDAERLFVKALEVSEQYGFLDQRLRVLNNLGVVYMEQGRWAEAIEQFTAVARAGGSVAPKEVPSALTNLLTVEYEQGNLEEAVKRGNRYLRETSLKTRLRLGCLALLGLAHLELGHLAGARECQHAIEANGGYDAGWSNDVSYLEIFRARMAVIDGRARQAVDRLRSRIKAFSEGYFYCGARMRIELLKIIAPQHPVEVLTKAHELRPSLTSAHAAPLVERLDRIITRCTNRG